MNPVATIIDRLSADQERRHAWLIEAGEIARLANEEARRELEKGFVPVIVEEMGEGKGRIVL